MRYPDNIVIVGDTQSSYSVAPSVPERCLYCKAALGGPHKEDCVCIQRPVKIRVTFDLVVSQVRSWNADDINCHANESSWCVDNILIDIERQMKASGCGCNFTKIEYTGEATIEEAIAAGLKLNAEEEGEADVDENSDAGRVHHYG